MSSNNSIVTMTDISRSFSVGKQFLGVSDSEVKALDTINLQIIEGETLGLVGESGCGKSTLARLLVALDWPTKGHMAWRDTPYKEHFGSGKAKNRKSIQMVFQDPYASLNPRMTARNSIAEPLTNFTGLSERDLYKKVNELAEQVGLGNHLLERFPHELSGGQCQRVGIARAIAADPQLLIADEPVSALDVSIQAQILNLLADIKQNLGLSMVFVSHDLSVVAHIADRVAVMYLGRIVEIGSAEAVFSNPQHPYTQMLLNSLPSPLPSARDQKVPVRGELPSPIDPPSGCHFRTRCALSSQECAQTRPELKVGRSGVLVACLKLEEVYSRQSPEHNHD